MLFALLFPLLLALPCLAGEMDDLCRAAQRPIALTVFDDASAHHVADAGQLHQLGGGGAIQVDARMSRRGTDDGSVAVRLSDWRAGAFVDSRSST
jgi:hypothetical protein